MSFIARPKFQLRSLPIPMRWEVTRRNAYYYVWWKMARAEHRRDVIQSPEDSDLRQFAVLLLGLIGVSGEPPDPATSFAQLGADQLENGWLSGAVHPVTMRGLAAILLAMLPQQTLAQVAETFLIASRDDVDDQTPKRIEAMQKLTSASWPGLDDFPDEPFVSINPAASERKIGEAIDQLIKVWKNERGLDEKRDRSDKYADYLRIWDLREGWSNGVYDRKIEKTFKEIAAMTQEKVSTLNNMYCRAFELIMGVPFSRELWVALFGPIKLSDLHEAGVARTHRPTKSPTCRDVPDSVVSRGSSQNGSNEESDSTTLIPGGRESGDDDTGYNVLLSDIASMLQRGRSDEQIGEELNIPSEAVAYIRLRGDVSSLRP